MHRFRRGLFGPSVELLDTDGLDAEGKEEGGDDDGDDEASGPELNLGHDLLCSLPRSYPAPNRRSR
jgi:hypothetical protein